jgi:hypothetical protein
MKKIGFILLPVCFLFIAMTGCEKEEGKEEKNPLAGTKWKLVGYTVGEEKMLKIFEPQDCEECYTLTFETNTFATGLSIIARVCIDLSDFSKCSNIEAIGELYDGDLYRDALAAVNSYSTTSEELKLFYGKNKCLIFKPVVVQECGRVEIQENEYVTMQATPEKVVLNTDIQLIIKNETKGYIIDGTVFSLDYLDGQNWIPVELDILFEDIAYIIGPGESREEKINFTSKYLKSMGIYRIKKSLTLTENIESSSSTTDRQYNVCAEFEVY